MLVLLGVFFVALKKEPPHAAAPEHGTAQHDSTPPLENSPPPVPSQVVTAPSATSEHVGAQATVAPKPPTPVMTTQAARTAPSASAKKASTAPIDTTSFGGRN
jgi:hypothetical protein